MPHNTFSLWEALANKPLLDALDALAFKIWWWRRGRFEKAMRDLAGDAVPPPQVYDFKVTFPSKK